MERIEDKRDEIQRAMWTTNGFMKTMLDHSEYNSMILILAMILALKGNDSDSDNDMKR